MTKKVLVAYGSKYGATREIAEKIGEVLSTHQLEVDVISADNAGDLAGYDAAVVGGAVYVGRWYKPAVRFLKKHVRTLAAMPVWFFSSGPTGEGEPVELLDGWTFPKNLQSLADQINPRDMAVFHGSINLEKVSGLDKRMLKAVGAESGDFRDWEAIATWAAKIAAGLP